MRHSGGLRNEEAHIAAREATRGALIGAAKWGLFGVIVGGTGYALSPVYRSLTVQFKVFIQMGFMVMGSSIEADHRMRLYEAQVRMQKRRMRDQATWDKYEEEYKEEPKKN
ncbi:hypothetical protein B7494_g6619 [Chlorociboria aeruginascens]|nr:hypothetical protein B7494_g6619 [Chlorociboria aeruginascens]